MKVTEIVLPGVKIIEPDVFPDGRGYFLETYQEKRYREFGIDICFVQDNLAFSAQGTLRGLHFQYPHSQAKLVQVVQGELLDVFVDVRRNSPTFGRWGSVRLSEKNHKQLFIPEGFAHGCWVLSDKTVFSYKCSDFYAPECGKGILWSDPDIGIDWPLKTPVLSEKDRKYPWLKNIPKEDLPEYRIV